MAVIAAPSLISTRLPLRNRREGKVRDVYDLPPHGGESRLLIVATDRISAFDVVMPTPIPGKGILLTDLSVSWFHWLRGTNLIKDHLVSTDVAGLEMLESDQRNLLSGRAMICRAARIVPIECVARGYLAGSGWNEYRSTGTVCGVRLPDGLRQGDAIPDGPIFTPATKESSGHDVNIDFAEMVKRIGVDVAEKLRSVTVAIYRSAAAYADSKGVLLADTKFEFGFALNDRGEETDELILADEVLTPDSSRYWPKEKWTPGVEQESFDKQFVREYLLRLVRAGAWDQSPPGPELPDEIVAKTLERYHEARRRLFS